MGARVMGILNVTPDSFSDGGRYLDRAAAIARGHQMIAEGADVIDVGGESTRPGAAEVDAALEVARVVPVVEALAPHIRVSVDTRKAEVAEAAIAAGATMVNDISTTLADLAASLGVGYVVMHMQGEPATMQEAPSYGDVVTEVLEFCCEHAEAARAAGCTEVWIDPGIGFGKTTAHNLALLGCLDRFVSSGWPVLVGASRKRFLGELLGRSDGTGIVGPSDRVEGSVTVATWGMAHGVQMVRAHDVRAAVHAARIVGDDGGRPPVRLPAEVSS
ncbi:MAG: dihydropteroate synthase [Acidimicrobiales bacterium]|nr:dihydropteroate synthase [Acidimicrobiales bacterium]